MRDQALAGSYQNPAGGLGIFVGRLSHCFHFNINSPKLLGTWPKVRHGRLATCSMLLFHDLRNNCTPISSYSLVIEPPLSSTIHQLRDWIQ